MSPGGHSQKKGREFTVKLEDLHYFISVGETGSITRAAQKHFMTQQGLSRIISGMEKELCTKLLVRNNNRIRLTPAGEAVMAGAREIEAAYWSMMDAISRVTRPECGETDQDFTIYTTPIMLNTVVPNVLSGLNQRFPQVRFAVNELNIWEIAQNVQFGEHCIALISWPSFRSEMYARVERDALHFEAIYKERIGLGVPKGHPLAGRASISNSELSGLPFATYYNEKDLLQRLLGGQDLPNILIHSTHLSLCHEMVEKGAAVALWSDLVDYYAQSDAIVQVPIDQSVDISYGCMWNETHPLSPVAQEVVNQTKQEFWRVDHAKEP